jgi:hypothetical protein
MAETSPAVKLMHGMTYTSLVTPGLGASAGDLQMRGTTCVS